MVHAVEAEFFYTFKDPQRLKLALVHKSHANEERARGTKKEEFVDLHNERLEFLGDSVLGLVISDLLFEKFPEADEGRLSRMRAALVRAETLAQVAKNSNLGKYIRLGKGEEITQGRGKDSILSSTYEAVLGAIYLDGGLAAVHATVKIHFAQLLDGVAGSFAGDTKTQLQELCQAKFHRSPQYKVNSEEGPDHAKIFEIMVSVGSYSRYGKGRNKKEAEQAAAGFLLEALEKEMIDASSTEA